MTQYLYADWSSGRLVFNLPLVTSDTLHGKTSAKSDCFVKLNVYNIGPQMDVTRSRKRYFYAERAIRGDTDQRSKHRER